MTFAKTLICSGFILVLNSTAFGQSMDTLPDKSTLPADVVQVSASVPLMGEHWANPQTLPLGPIYCVHDDKVVCIEYMIAQQDFADGKSWPTLAGLTNLPSINHVDIGFEPHGHEGYEIPHYDLHIFFISPEEKAKITE
ncbi:hypothetical protein PSQ90_07320 [Devosia rhodophyticola]|uniref:DUF5602 domain-containing protein n=1 Tax=Devosia rhodophyticola TaxID=3026423 RepID=A0ABY7Z1F4_9HYPH|nr:hypothetical protein [Devosia rhodophyticola]WDR07227.1 hypothetical protein PSQ90_07320 [Devosia rhodophyticola]